MAVLMVGLAMDSLAETLNWVLTVPDALPAATWAYNTAASSSKASPEESSDRVIPSAALHQLVDGVAYLLR